MKVNTHINKLMSSMKIKTKLISIFTVVVMVPIFLIGAYMITSLTRIMDERTIEQANNSVKIIQYRLNEILACATDVSNRIYINSKIHDTATRQYKNNFEILEAYKDNDIMQEYLRAYNELKSIRLYVENNTLLDNSNFINANDTIRKKDWYQDARTHPGIIKWMYKTDEYFSENYLSLIRGVTDGNGKTVGVLVITINPDAINALIKDEKYETMITLGDTYIAAVKESLLSIRDYNDIYNKEEREENYIEDVDVDNESMSTIINAFTTARSNSKFEVIMALPHDEITSKSSKVIKVGIMWIVVCCMLSLFVIVYFSNSMSERIHILGSEMHKVALGKFDIKDKINGNDEIASLYDDLNTMKESLKNLIDEVYVEKIKGEQLKIKQQEVQFKVLASQINPHFLYNTLETIRMKAYCNKEKEIADLVKMLGKIMRRNLEATDKEVTIKSEIELMENYLKIQQARFGDKVDYECNVSIDESKLILPLLIQPVVENAFVHGIEKSLTKGLITINIFEENKHTIIEINDNGIGMDYDSLKKLRDKISSVDNDAKKSIGLTNVNQRIKIFYGEEYGMYIESLKGKGTDVILTLPILEGDSDYVKSINS